MTYIDTRTRANAAESGVPHAPEEVIAEWHALAETVCGELRHAGLPAYVVHPGAPADRRAGACVSVDTLDGPAGGVHVDWNPGDSLTDAALGCMEPGRSQLLEPVIEHYVRVGSLMDETIRSVLTLAGFRTRDAVELDDLSSGTHVAGRQPRQWYLEYILTEGVLGLIAALRSYRPSGDDPAEPAGAGAEGTARIAGRGIRIVQDGRHRLTDDDRRELDRVLRRLAGAMHSQDMAHKGFWKADRSLLELPDELCLPARQSPARVLTAAYLALLGSIESAGEDTVDDDDAVEITEASTGTLLRRLDQAPDEDRRELIRLFREAARDETDPDLKSFATGFPEAIGLADEDE
ncbi:hypothetical protein JK361_04585 [Streptomyces sp. 5-8]|uniref:Uncharacterized protein n=1 Tax=Streptomyces musisoli TaxID=2802280 RepID=A0ABS1NVB4_9ACTN|nr:MULTISPECIES: hypothetical protein [Streptomyces]MBL1103889.1 hypothetical protein [Streptomyces musisoli]MBY8843930.1 hypothetical protein [Streptomyces sp. SP2-10]